MFEDGTESGKCEFDLIEVLGMGSSLYLIDGGDKGTFDGKSMTEAGEGDGKSMTEVGEGGFLSLDLMEVEELVLHLDMSSVGKEIEVLFVVLGGGVTTEGGTDCSLLVIVGESVGIKVGVEVLSEDAALVFGDKGDIVISFGVKGSSSNNVGDVDLTEVEDFWLAEVEDFWLVSCGGLVLVWGEVNISFSNEGKSEILVILLEDVGVLMEDFVSDEVIVLCSKRWFCGL